MNLIKKIWAGFLKLLGLQTIPKTEVNDLFIIPKYDRIESNGVIFFVPSNSGINKSKLDSLVNVAGEIDSEQTEFQKKEYLASKIDESIEDAFTIK